MAISAIYLPKILRMGAGASGELPAVLAELGLARPLLMSSSRRYIDKVERDLAQVGISCGVFAECVADPTVASIEAAMRCWQQGNYDAIVAVGGGSSIDSAKAVAVLARHGGTIRDYKEPNAVPMGVPVIAIPTTAGTGSEVTNAMVITDTDAQEKMLCMGIGVMPTAALVDFELTLSMPARLTVDTGLDSLCHGIEAYISRKANAFTDTMALASMAAIAKHIRQVYAQPSDRAAREAMMLAATQAGIAFANASVTLIHGMSRPLGAFFHVPHGLSNAMLLPAITAFSLPGAAERYADCARAMGFASENDSTAAAGVALIDGLYQLCEDLSVPSPQGFGINEADYLAAVGTMAAQALASGSPDNNPLIPRQEQIERLYHAIWKGTGSR